MASALFSKKILSEDDLVDLHGKVAIVTGGNTGVGYGTVQFLVRKGAKVYIAGRDEGRVSAAITQLETEGIADGSLHWLKLDLSDPRSANQAGEEFIRMEKRLDILVNNAAVGAVGPYHINKDGLRDVMVINHISHFAFTEALLPLLNATSKEDSSDVRIVNLTSIAHARVKTDSFIGKESLNKDYGNSVGGYLDTYGYSKLANVLHIKELQRRLDSDNIPIICIATHPGTVATVGSNQFLSSLPYFGKFIATFVGPMFFGPWQKGAMTSTFAAAAKEVKDNQELYKGAYLTPVGRITEPSKSALEPKLGKELYETTQEVLRELGIH